MLVPWPPLAVADQEQIGERTHQRTVCRVKEPGTSDAAVDEDAGSEEPVDLVMQIAEVSTDSRARSRRSSLRARAAVIAQPAAGLGSRFAAPARASTTFESYTHEIMCG